ncbi:MAG: type II toxin-antitoxin system ParD family antitoxin [Pirellulales bacterium]
MPTQFTPEIDAFVQAQLAAGHYQTEQEVVLDALRAFRELSLRHQSLLDDVRNAIAQADAGQLHPLDTEKTKIEARRRAAGLPAD